MGYFLLALSRKAMEESHKIWVFPGLHIEFLMLATLASSTTQVTALSHHLEQSWTL